MACLEPEVEYPKKKDETVQKDEAVQEEAFLEVEDPGAVSSEDKFVNVVGSSLNYVSWMRESLGPFCADKSSLKGAE